MIFSQNLISADDIFRNGDYKKETKVNNLGMIKLFINPV